MKNLKQRSVPMALIALCYWVNRLVFIPHTTGTLHAFCTGYVGDILAGALIFAVLNLFLTLAGFRPVRRILPATLFLLLCGLFWEFVTPLYRPDSVTDVWDIPAYWLGGVLMCLWDRRR